MAHTRRKVVGAVALLSSAMLLAACAGPAATSTSKLTDGKVVIGVLNDQSGVYKDLSGPNSVIAVQMAVDDYKAKYGDKAVATNIQIVKADTQNKPDVGNVKAEAMYDRQQADVILDVPASSVALAVAKVAAAKKKLYMNVTAATTDLSGPTCNKYTFHWAYDTQMLAKGANGVVAAGGKTWAIVYPDYAFGQNMSKSFTAAVEAAGGKVVASIPTPFPNDNFATFITKAQASNPDVIGIMAAGGDLINFVKQYNTSGAKAQLAVGLMFITDIHSLGVDQFTGTTFTDAWYWNYDKKNRDWADRFLTLTDTRPSFAHAANYSAATQYLEAVQRAGTDNADAVVKELEGKKLEDLFLRGGEVRADHSVIHDSYTAQVKTAAQVTEDWDFEKIIATNPAKDAFGPVNPECKL